MPGPFLWGPNNKAINLESGYLNPDGSYNKNDGPKNYLVNPQIETGLTTGWTLGVTGALTNNVPTTTPTFGSGASGNLTLSATSTTPLAGTFSLSYASSAATTAGNMVASSAFTIDVEDQVGKVLNFSFSYKATTGTANANWSGTSSSSFGVAIYDVTNSAWIIPTGVFNFTQGVGVGKCTGSFQTSATGTSYRLVVYNANATSGAITMYFDSFFLGPQSTGLVSAISDWSQNNTGFVPSAGFGTVTSASYFYRRVGDSAEVIMTWVNGTVAASTASVALPFTIDSTKISSNASGTWIGQGTRDVTVATRAMWSNNDAYAVFYDGSTTNTVFITTNTGSSTFSKANGSSIGSSSDAVSIRFTVPVSGWTSGLSVSGASASLGQVAAELNTASSTTVTANTAITFTTLGFDTTGSVSSLNKFTAPVTGPYLVSYYNDATTATGTRPYVAKNGTFTATNANILTSSGSVTAAGGAILIQLNAGDFIQIAYNTSATLVSTSVNWNIALIQGPSTGGATASVNARYFASSTSISGSLATVVWTTKDFDSANAMSSGVYTIPITGKYQVNSAVATTGTFALNNQLIIEIQKNGTVVSRDKNYAGGVVTDLTAAISDIISCVAGDTIRIQLSSGATSPSIVSSNFENYFSISLVGN